MHKYNANIANNKTTSTKPNGYDDEYVKNVSSKLYEHIYLENANKTKYDSILKSLKQQYSFGNNQHPTSITEANNILNYHKLDGNYIKSRSNQRNQNAKEKENMIEEEEPLLLTFTQIKGKCYCCGKSDHKLPQCSPKVNGSSRQYSQNKLARQYQKTMISVQALQKNHLNIIATPL